MLYRIVASAVIVIVGIVLRSVLNSWTRRRVRRLKLQERSAVLARKLTSTFVILGAVLALGFVWGVGARNIWVSLASVVALVAIGFFAVWCILSNIVAGLIVLISRPFDIGDEVTFLPDNIQGTVTDITVLFLVLQDEEGNSITIPNNFVFQKLVKTVKKKNGA